MWRQSLVRCRRYPRRILVHPLAKMASQKAEKKRTSPPRTTVREARLDRWYCSAEPRGLWDRGTQIAQWPLGTTCAGPLLREVLEIIHDGCSHVVMSANTSSPRPSANTSSICEHELPAHEFMRIVGVARRRARWRCGLHPVGISSRWFLTRVEGEWARCGFRRRTV